MRATRRLGSVLTLLVALLATALVTGLLAAGLLIPAVGAAGLASNKSIGLFNGLPSTFAMNPLAQQSRILAADGSVIATPFNENRIVVPMKKIAPIMRKAQVAIEDERFYQHGGIDPKGLVRALTSNAQGGGVQGASTLTQQYVKVSLLNQANASGNTAAAKSAVAREGLQGYVRKLQELRYATSLEQKYTKDQILNGYLNVVYYGDQQYGVEAAAQHYFSVPASKLSIPQAALLAGVVNAPTTYDPVTNPKNSQARRDLVLAKMLQQKIITSKEYAAAKSIPVSKMLKLKNTSGNCSSSKYPYFCTYVTEWLKSQPALGKDRATRTATLKSGGLTIKTTFQPKMAAIIDKQLRSKVPEGNKTDVNAAAAMIKPGTGDILAIGQNTSYSNTQSRGKTSLNLSNAKFQFGSSAKFFAIVTALQQGASPNNTIDVRSQGTRMPNGNLGTNFPLSDFNGPCYSGGRGVYGIGNDFPVPIGPMPYAQAAAWSVNTAFGELAAQVGICNIADTMVKLGLDKKSIEFNPSGIILGTSLSSPIEMANAYATAAAGGKYCPPKPVTSITDGNGKALKISIEPCKQVMSAKVAAETTKIFQAVLNPNDPKATAHQDALAADRPAAGKTGTVEYAKNIWFVGYTPQLSTAVWVGHGGNSQPPLKNISLAGTYYDHYIFASDLPAPMWKGIMDAALQGKPVKQFPAAAGGDPNQASAPASSNPTPTQVAVPNVVGQNIKDAISTLQAAGFHVQVQGRGKITRMSATGDAKEGTTINIFAGR